MQPDHFNIQKLAVLGVDLRNFQRVVQLTSTGIEVFLFDLPFTKSDPHPIAMSDKLVGNPVLDLFDKNKVTSDIRTIDYIPNRGSNCS
jgi:hypothetical protein